MRFTQAATRPTSSGVLPNNAGSGCTASTKRAIASPSARTSPSAKRSAGTVAEGFSASIAAPRCSAARRSTTRVGRVTPFSARNQRSRRGLGAQAASKSRWSAKGVGHGHAPRQADALAVTGGPPGRPSGRRRRAPTMVVSFSVEPIGADPRVDGLIARAFADRPRTLAPDRAAVRLRAGADPLPDLSLAVRRDGLLLGGAARLAGAAGRPAADADRTGGGGAGRAGHRRRGCADDGGVRAAGRAGRAGGGRGLLWPLGLHPPRQPAAGESREPSNATGCWRDPAVPRCRERAL